MRNPLILSLGLGMVGCSSDSKVCDSLDTACVDTADDQGPPPETPSIDQISWDCDETGYSYQVLTVGWTGDGLLQIAATGDDSENRWQEPHPLPSTDSDPDGWWDQLQLQLEILQEPYCSGDPDAEDACWKYQTAGESTLWTCDDETTARLTWAVTIYDADDPTVVVECSAWGHDPTFFPGCDDVNDEQ